MLRKALSPLLNPLWICLIFALVSGCRSPRGDSGGNPSLLVPIGWKPSLGQVQTTLQDELEKKAPKSQQYLNRTSQNLSDLADAQLFIAYTLLIQNLDGKEQKALFEEHFKQLLRDAGRIDPKMRQIQDEFFDQRYFQPAHRSWVQAVR